MQYNTVRNSIFLVSFPGDDFFDRFCANADGSHLIFMQQNEVENFLSRHIDIDEWKYLLHQYVSHINKDELCLRSQVFVIESQQFKTNSNPSRTISVLVGS